MATDFCRVGRQWANGQPNPRSSRAACKSAVSHAESRLCDVHYAELIESKPERCNGCSLRWSGWGYAPAEGPEEADILAIAEALGEEEAYSGKNLYGGSGKMWNAMLYHAGVYRNELRVTNTCRCRPPGNRKPTDDEIKFCTTMYLGPELARHKPNLVLLLGATPLYLFHGTQEIGLFRGVPDATKDGQKTLATFHPAYIARQQQLWPICVHDFIRAKKESLTPNFVRHPVHYDITSDAASLRASLLERARRAGFVIFDLETTDLDPRTSYIKCCGFGTEAYRASCPDWSDDAHALLTELFVDPSIEVVGQNSEGFDIPFVYEHGVRRLRGRSFDTLLAFHLTNSDLPKSLATIATFYTDMKFWKSKREMYHSTYEALKHGCCQDVDATTRSYLGLKQELREMNLEKLYYESVMPLQPVLRAIGARGKKKDQEKADYWTVGLRRAISKYTTILREGLGMPGLDLASPKQVQDLLYNKLGLPIQWARDAKKGSMRPTADAKAIEALVEQFPEHKSLRLISEVRSAEHQISTNLQVETDERGFVHPVYDSRTAANGRLASRGPNDQNIPLMLREIYVPDDKDHVFYTRDWAQIEWVVAMVLAGDAEGLRRVTSGIDIHVLNAAYALGKNIADVNDDDRHQAKFFVYGLGYGRGDESIAKALGKSEEWAAEFRERFFQGLPDYAEWRDDLTTFWSKNQCLINPFGRRRWWYTRKVTEFFNFPPSSVAADMMIKILIKLEEQLPKGATLRGSVHDEVVICCHRDVARETEQCTAEIMSGTVWPEIVAASRHPSVVKKYYPQGWSCPSEGNFGTNWKMCKGKKDDKAACAVLRKELGL